MDLTYNEIFIFLEYGVLTIYKGVTRVLFLIKSLRFTCKSIGLCFLTFDIN